MMCLNARAFAPVRGSAPRRAAPRAAAATLDESTLWQLFFSLRWAEPDGEKTLDRGGVDAVVLGRFVEEAGYEPPQGVFEVVQDSSGVLAEGATHRWMLSEDPNDRKDGLWVWGLFKEPLYPFLLLELATADVPFPSGFSLPAGTLGVTLDHARDSSEVAVVLPGIGKGVGASVQLANGRVAYRVLRRYNADLAGLSKVDVKEDLALGTVRATPAEPAA